MFRLDEKYQQRDLMENRIMCYNENSRNIQRLVIRRRKVYQNAISEVLGIQASFNLSAKYSHQSEVYIAGKDLPQQLKHEIQ